MLWSDVSRVNAYGITFKRINASRHALMLSYTQMLKYGLFFKKTSITGLFFYSVITLVIGRKGLRATTSATENVESHTSSWVTRKACMRYSRRTSWSIHP
jgi:hypothetical protein